jgi:hypothetical protein
VKTLEVGSENFISDEAKLAAICGQYSENFNEFQNKIPHGAQSAKPEEARN